MEKRILKQNIIDTRRALREVDLEKDIVVVKKDSEKEDEHEEKITTYEATLRKNKGISFYIKECPDSIRREHDIGRECNSLRSPFYVYTYTKAKKFRYKDRTKGNILLLEKPEQEGERGDFWIETITRRLGGSATIDILRILLLMFHSIFEGRKELGLYHNALFLKNIIVIKKSVDFQIFHLNKGYIVVGSQYTPMITNFSFSETDRNPKDDLPYKRVTLTDIVTPCVHIIAVYGKRFPLLERILKKFVKECFDIQDSIASNNDVDAIEDAIRSFIGICDGSGQRISSYVKRKDQ